MTMKLVTFVLIPMFFLLAACGADASSSSEATPTPGPTNTSTPRPTLTPLPSATPYPTPAPLGSTVRTGTLEITILDVITHSLIVPGGLHYYLPNKGDIFVDLGVRVRNLHPEKPMRFKWGEIYILEENGDEWNPGLADSKSVGADERIDPFSIPIGKELGHNEILEIDEAVYLRLIFMVEDNPELTILFGIQDSQQIAFHVDA
jgi:hypothetical protein